jgi:hypothetical protein
MKTTRFVGAVLALIIFAPYLFAQEKTTSARKEPTTTLKLQVLITEHEGEKKLASLPYTFFLQAGEDGHVSPWTKVRMGSRVPVATGSYQAGSGSSANNVVSPLVNTQFQYIDVGTNIDARALTPEEGRFDLTLNLERSWVEGDVLLPGETQSAVTGESTSHPFRQPIIRQFKTELSLTMHDGQTIQSTQATDPLSGRVLTVTVTMNVVK